MSDDVVSQREAARRGRIEQLKTLADFEAGKLVVFKVANNPKGFRVDPGQIKAKPHNGRKLAFSAHDRLVDAVINSDAAEVEALLAKGANPNVRDADGLTPLHRACTEGVLGVVSMLVGAGADVNACDDEWWTPLHSAAAAGNWRIVNHLVSQGADVRAVNADGDLPIDLVADAKVESVLQREMERLGVDEEKLEELRRAPQARALELTREKIQSRADLNAQGPRGETLLHVAASCGYVDMARLLLEQPGLRLEVRDHEGHTPLHLAAFFNEYEIALMLCNKGADIHARNKLGQRPIVLSEDETMIRLLSLMDKKYSVEGGGGGGGEGSGAQSKSASMHRLPRTQQAASLKRSQVGEGHRLSQRSEDDA